MGAEIINLRLARKRNKRARKAVEARVNTLKSGQTKTERARTASEKSRLERAVDGALRDGHGDGPGKKP